VYHHERLRTGKVVPLKRDSIIGTDPKFEAFLEQLALSASTGIPLLIIGETGVGSTSRLGIIPVVPKETSPILTKGFCFCKNVEE